jgi:hypothetical protein
MLQLGIRSPYCLNLLTTARLEQLAKLGATVKDFLGHCRPGRAQYARDVIALLAAFGFCGRLVEKVLERKLEGVNRWVDEGLRGTKHHDQELDQDFGLLLAFLRRIGEQGDDV